MALVNAIKILDRRFKQLVREVEYAIIWDMGPFSYNYLQCWRNKYYAAHKLCKKFLRNEMCEECFIIKLQCMQIEHYETNYDSGIEM